MTAPKLGKQQQPAVLAQAPSAALASWIAKYFSRNKVLQVGTEQLPLEQLPGAEIGYDQITASVQPITSTTSALPTTVIPGSTYEFDGGPVIAEVYATIQLPSASLAQFHVGLFEAALIAQLGLLENPAAAICDMPLKAAYRFTPPAGLHTYSIGCWVSVATGNPGFLAGAAGGGLAPAYLRFTKV